MSVANGVPDPSAEQNYGSYPVQPLLVPGTKTISSVVVNPEGRIESVVAGTLPGPATANAHGVTAGSPVGPGVAQAQSGVTVTGCKTTSVAFWSLPNAPDATWQTGISVLLVVGTNVVTPYLVNPTAATITPVTQTLNIGCNF